MQLYAPVEVEGEQVTPVEGRAQNVMFAEAALPGMVPVMVVVGAVR